MSDYYAYYYASMFDAGLEPIDISCIMSVRYSDQKYSRHCS